MAFADFDEIDALIANGTDAADALLDDAKRLVRDVADAGLREATENHPYTDRTNELTGDAHVEPEEADGGGFSDTSFGAAIVWPAPYAAYVDEGTRHAKPYPFSPIAEKKATETADYGAEAIADAFVDRVGGG